MGNFILALDQGTSSCRAVLFDRRGLPVSMAQREFSQIYPEPGWVEHDPLEIWDTQYETVREALGKAGILPGEITGIGITNQRETTVIWNRKTGRPVYNAIVWQDRRTTADCERLKKEQLSDVVREKTGLIIDAYFSATKISWILDNVPGARRMAEEGELAFGNTDSWLVWKLTEGKHHVTDVTNASRTMLFNIHDLTWDSGLLGIFNIPASILPEVKSSSEIYGMVEQPLLRGVPVAGIAGDQQAALFGQMCVEPGMVKNTYGTGCFLMMNTGTFPVTSSNNLLTTVAWKIGDKTEYALEGSIFIAGAVVQWLRDSLGLIRKSSEIEDLALTVNNNGGAYLVPAFAGLGAPQWNQKARGTLVGLTRGTTGAHIARAALESIAFQTLDVLESMRRDAASEIIELRVDGGASVNDMLMQFQSDILGTKVVRPVITETTALGSAYLAGLATGFWTSIDEIKEQWRVEKEFHRMMNLSETKQLISNWHRAVKTAVYWASEE